jgi:hypothetical protein
MAEKKRLETPAFKKMTPQAPERSEGGAAP